MTLAAWKVALPCKANSRKLVRTMFWTLADYLAQYLTLSDHELQSSCRISGPGDFAVKRA